MKPDRLDNNAARPRRCPPQSDNRKGRQAEQDDITHLLTVAACLDGAENGSHVSVTETERARLAIERVADIE